MNQRKLVRLISERTGESATDIALIMEAMVSTMSELLVEGEKVSITRLGTFKLKERKERNGYDPYRSKAIEIPVRKHISFDANKYLKSKLKEME